MFWLIQRLKKLTVLWEVYLESKNAAAKQKQTDDFVFSWKNKDNKEWKWRRILHCCLSTCAHWECASSCIRPKILFDVRQKKSPNCPIWH